MSSKSDRLAIIAAIYDKRSSGYDNEDNFHSRQAKDYLQWMDCKPGNHVLDLACGTGAITLPSKKAAGELGRVIGIDISNDSISIASQKALAQDLEVMFIHHDICQLDGVGLGLESFDIITCASALVLLEDPVKAVKNWARFLKPGGRIIFDVPTKNSSVAGYLLNVVAKQLHISMPYDRTRLSSLQEVIQLLVDAGLDARESFLSDDYGGQQLNVSDASDIYNKMVFQSSWSEAIYTEIKAPEINEKAREMFCAEFTRIASAGGKVDEELRFYMGVGRKPVIDKQ